MININNYEEYFLDYCEGNIDEEGRREVMQFVSLHPELRAELEEFYESPILSNDNNNVHIPQALSDSLRRTSSYNDADVPYFERLAVVNIEKIATPAEQLEYQRLKYENSEYRRIASQYSSTILVPEKIEYPYKHRLIILPLWRKILPYAAAAAIAAVAYTLWPLEDNSNINQSIIDTDTQSVIVDLPISRVNNDETTTEKSEIVAQEETKTSDEPTNTTNTATIASAHTNSNIAKPKAECNPKEQAIQEIQPEHQELPNVLAESEEKAVAEIAPITINNEDPLSNADTTIVADIEIDMSSINAFDTKTNVPRKHRRNFFFACGNVLTKVMRRVKPGIHIEIDRNVDGEVCRVAMQTLGKTYSWQRSK